MLRTNLILRFIANQCYVFKEYSSFRFFRWHFCTGLFIHFMLRALTISPYQIFTTSKNVTIESICRNCIYTGWSKSLCAPDHYNPHTIDDLKMVITGYIRNVDRAILNTVFENTVRRVNKCLERLAGDILNIACCILYCNHQVHRDFLITLYVHRVY